MTLPDIKKYGAVFGRGLVGYFAPGVMQGALVELFKTNKLNVKKAVEWVEADKSLWGSLDPEKQEQMKKLAHNIGTMDWATVDWAIDAIKEDFPAVASMFLSWRKATNWLRRQVEQIRKEMVAGLTK